MKSTFRALKHKKFAALLFGQTLSRIGDFLFQIALAWWVLERTGSAATMGTVMFFSLLPMVVFSLVGGVVVDRMPRGLLLFFSDMGRCFIMLIAAWLAWRNEIQVWEIYLIALFFGFADAFFLPAYNALIQQIIPQEDLPSANAINSLSMQFGRVAGPAIGGLITGLGGTTVAFGLNALSFFIGGLTVAALLNLPQPARAEGTESTLRQFAADLKDGFQTIMASPILWVTILVAALVNVTLSGPYNIGMPFLVKNHLGGDEKMLGLIYSIFPIGYATASLVAGSFTKLRRRGIIFYACSAVAGLGIAAFGLDVPFYVLVIAALFNGAALEIDGLIWMNLLQEKVPPEKMGRVSSVDMVGSFVLLPLGFAVTGWLVDTIGVTSVFIACGLLAALFSLLPILHPQIRNVD